MRRESAKETVYVNQVAATEKGSETNGFVVGEKLIETTKRKFQERDPGYQGYREIKEYNDFGKGITFGPLREQFQYFKNDKNYIKRDFCTFVKIMLKKNGKSF